MVNTGDSYFVLHMGALLQKDKPPAGKTLNLYSIRFWRRHDRLTPQLQNHLTIAKSSSQKMLKKLDCPCADLLN